MNVVKLQAGYSLTRITGRIKLLGKPYSLSVEPTTSCNLRCPECPSGLRQFPRYTGMMDFESFKKIIDETHKHLIYLLLYFQGEPYLNPAFFDFVKYAKKHRIYTATSTNAHFLTEENAGKTIDSGLDRLIISLDGIGQEAYSAYRIGGRYDQVIKGIQNIVKLKRELKSCTPYI
ncbi:MAG: radical SAM protein, partial [Bacteroidales bacterium]|nr:radical SAM protein [Bacteroidales bacterium]